MTDEQRNAQEAEELERCRERLKSKKTICNCIAIVLLVIGLIVTLSAMSIIEEISEMTTPGHSYDLSEKFELEMQSIRTSFAGGLLLEGALVAVIVKPLVIRGDKKQIEIYENRASRRRQEELYAKIERTVILATCSEKVASPSDIGTSFLSDLAYGDNAPVIDAINSAANVKTVNTTRFLIINKDGSRYTDEVVDDSYKYNRYIEFLDV